MIKKLLPQKIFYYLTTIKAMWKEIKRYVLHSNTYYTLDSQSKFHGYMTMKYHVIEKGLTMHETRLGFGKMVVSELIELCNIYKEKKYDLNALPYAHSVRLLNEYLRYHQDNRFNVDKEIVIGINKISGDSTMIPLTEQKLVTKNDFFSFSKAPFNEFCISRHSVRDFITKDIPLETIFECIKLANKSPSACNRQPTRVYVVKGKQKILSILELQNGNRGFGYLADTLLVISSNISVFQSVDERNEPYINAGLFSMTLAYALHFREIGTCFLNWSVSGEKDKLIRKILNIPDNEVIALIIACGYVPDEIKVASSPRFGTGEISYLFE